MTYSLDIKQLTVFLYCRIYRSFIGQLTADPTLRKNGDGLLFYCIVLFSMANYRTSYRTLESTQFTIRAGEWVAEYAERKEKMGLKYHRQLRGILSRLQAMHLIAYTEFPKKRLVKFRICDWENGNTVLDYNAPCRKDIGFFFFPIDAATGLISSGKCSEADILLDLCLHTVFNDSSVLGSDTAPMVYYRNGSGAPFVNYAELAERWGLSKTSVHRILKKLEAKSLIQVFSFPGNRGSVIYLKNYLSTMFCVSDLAPTQEQVFLHLTVQTADKVEEPGDEVLCGTLSGVSDAAAGVPNPNIRKIMESTRKALYASGLSCSACPHALYGLSSLSDCKESPCQYDLAIQCGSGSTQYYYRLTLWSDAGSAPREVI